MTSVLKLCVLIPVYNHPLKLTGLVEQFLLRNLAVILIDDGSDINCRELMEQLADKHKEVTLDTHRANMGKGAAIKTGLRAAERLGFTHALQVDADGQHDLNDIPRFVALMKANPEALVAGYPEYDESVPKHRYYGRYASHVWVWINSLSMEIVDSMCGYRIYPVHSSNQLLASDSVGNRMEFDGEFIVKWVWAGGALKQLKTKVHYPEDGASHFRLWRDNLLISVMHTRLFFGMLKRLPMLVARRWSLK